VKSATHAHVDPMNVRKFFPLSGIVFVVLALGTVIAIAGNTPGSDASAAKVAAFYGDNVVRQGIGSFVLAASVPFLVFFGIGLAAALAQAERGPSSLWRQVLVAGTLLAAAGVLVTALVHVALVDGGDHNLSPTALQAVNVIDGNTWIAFNAGFGVMMLGAAGALLNAGALRWLGWSALVLGIVLFVPFADFFALMLTLVWIVVTAIALARRAERPSAVEVATAT
jgi:hypothetical protein